MITSPDHQRHDDRRGISHCREVVEETACGLCGFLVMAAGDQYTELWALVARHEQDPDVGHGMDRLA
ncbi:hypothetical protein [Streptosporangium roseum]|uniref:hypothetical protein n=1 Tax=Streptosporangium roseum TaxID=2001 RepID=UPI003334A4B4